jgi:hypothetical protein
MKSPLRWSKASGSTKRRVEEILRGSRRGLKRQFDAVDRRTLSQRLELQG